MVCVLTGKLILIEKLLDIRIQLLRAIWIKKKSLTGYAFTLSGSVISWKVTLQSTVALSTREAEYMAVTESVKETIWLRGLVEDLGLHQE